MVEKDLHQIEQEGENTSSKNSEKKKRHSNEKPMTYKIHQPGDINFTLIQKSPSRR